MTAGAGLGEYSDATASAREGAGLDFRALFESAPGSCLALNPDFVIVAVSDAYLRDAKTSRAQIVGQPILDVRPYCGSGSGAARAADLRASLERVRANCLPDAMAVQKYDIHQPESAGGGFEVRYWSPVNSPALDPRGRLAYIVHEVEDVTEYVRFKQQEARHQHLTQQLPRRAEQMEADIFARSQELEQASLALRADNDAKTQFLSRVSHELRTPLNTILGFGELLSYSDITAEHREWMSMMLRAARSLVQLLDEALDISRTDAEHLSLSIEAVSVQEVIADVVELARPLAISRGVQLDPPPRLEASLYAAADVRRLRQVMQKLLSNAIKYNHPAGQVTVTVDRRPGERIRISIADTGRGILKDQIGSLFVPFERLDAARTGIEGTGLGLALSRQLIHKMDGAIGASSVPGEGSIFWIELPASEPVAVAQPVIGHDPLVASRAYSAPKTVLYVEDMVENLRLVEQVLKQRPSTTVVPALLAAAALDLARQHRPDLILLDAHLPDMPGEEVIRQLLADPVTRDIPIIILSADTAQAHIEQLLAAGARAYLTKPIRVRELLQTVDDVLDQADPMLDRSAVPADLASRHPSAPGGC